MQVKDFKELTSFVNDEADKFFETYGEKLVVADLVGALIKNLTFYFKLEAAYLRRKEKRELKLKEAIETMPHCFIWKLFHYDLWRQIKDAKADELREQKVKKAIETMPHSSIWKLMHPKLWAQINAIKKEQDEFQKKEEERVSKSEQEVKTKELAPIEATVAVVTVKEPVVEVEEPD